MKCAGLLLLVVGLLCMAGQAGAVVITPGRVASGSIDAVGETDTWEFTANAGDWVRFALVHGAGSAQLELFMKAPNEDQVAYSGSPFNRGTREVEIKSLPQSGVYRIHVQDVGQTETSAYSIYLMKIPGQTTSPADQDGGELQDDTALHGTLVPADMDIYTIAAEQGDNIRLRMFPTSGGFQGEILLFAPDKAQLAYQGSPFNNNSREIVCNNVAQTGVYTVVCRDVGMDNSGSYDVQLNITPIRPRVFHSLPAAGAQNVSPVTDILLRFSRRMRMPTVEHYTTLTTMLPGAKEAKVPCQFVWAGAQAVHLVPAAPLQYGQAYRLKVDHRVKSEAGLYLWHDEDFICDFTTSQSLIASSSPAEGEGAAMRRGGVRINFRWPVRPVSVNGRVVLRDAQGNPVPGTIHWAVPRKAAVFVPSDALAANGDYTAAVLAGIRLDSGRMINWDEEVEFQTNNRPTVLVYAPQQNGDLTQGVQITFDRAMRRASVQNNFMITPTLPGTFAWELSGRRLVFRPLNAFAPMTAYTVQVKAAATAVDGQTLGRTFSWSFRTGAAPAQALVVSAAAGPAGRGAQVTVNLSSAATVGAVVCNLAGREVAVLPARPMAAGMGTLVWDGLGRTGTQVPHGQYLVRISAHGASGTKAEAVCGVQLR